MTGEVRAKIADLVVMLAQLPYRYPDVEAATQLMIIALEDLEPTTEELSTAGRNVIRTCRECPAPAVVRDAIRKLRHDRASAKLAKSLAQISPKELPEPRPVSAQTVFERVPRGYVRSEALTEELRRRVEAEFDAAGRALEKDR